MKIHSIIVGDSQSGKTELQKVLCPIQKNRMWYLDDSSILLELRELKLHQNIWKQLETVLICYDSLASFQGLGNFWLSGVAENAPQARAIVVKTKSDEIANDQKHTEIVFQGNRYLHVETSAVRNKNIDYLRGLVLNGVQIIARDLPVSPPKQDPDVSRISVISDKSSFSSPQDEKLFRKSVNKRYEQFEDSPPIVKVTLPANKSYISQALNQSESIIQPESNNKKISFITLKINFGGQIITEQVYKDDTAYSIALRAFKKSKAIRQVDKIRKLSDLIEQQVNTYTNSLVKEEPQEPQQVQRPKTPVGPPKLHTSSRAVNRRKILGNIAIDINGQEVSLEVRQGDNPEQLAKSFIKSNDLQPEFINELLEPIEEILNSQSPILFEMVLDIEGTESTIAIRENEDLYQAALIFVKKQGLKPGSVGKIHKMLERRKRMIYQQVTNIYIGKKL